MPTYTQVLHRSNPVLKIGFALAGAAFTSLAIAQVPNFCAYLPNTNSICKPSLPEAEAWLKAQPGFECVENQSLFINSGASQTLNYVCPKKAPTDLGTKYYAGGGACGPSGLCLSEEQVLQYIRNQYNGCAVNVSMVGTFPQPYQRAYSPSFANFQGTLLGTDGCQPLANRRSIRVTYHESLPGGGCGTTLYGPQDRGNAYTFQGVNCPANYTFVGGYSVGADLAPGDCTTYNRKVPCDEICKPPEAKIIVNYSPQNPSCPKTGTPCVPGTGAKELTTGPLASGWPISFNYLSFRDVPGKSGVGSNWRHNFSGRIANIAQALDINATVVAITNEAGYIETYTKVATDTFRADYAAGNIMKRSAGGFDIAEPSGRHLIFNTDGLLTSVSYASNPINNVVLAYANDQKLTSLTTGSGRVFTFAYSMLGALTQITGPDGQTAQISTAAAGGNLSAVQFPGQTVPRTYLYENTQLTDRVTGIIDERGTRFSTYAYETSTGRVIESKYAGDVMRSQLSYPSDNVATLIGPLNASTSYTFSGGGRYRRMTALTDPAGALSQTYNANDQISSVLDRRGVTTEYGYSDGIHETVRIDKKPQKAWTPKPQT